MRNTSINGCLEWNCSEQIDFISAPIEKSYQRTNIQPPSTDEGKQYDLHDNQKWDFDCNVAQAKYSLRPKFDKTQKHRPCTWAHK